MSRFDESLLARALAYVGRPAAAAPSSLLDTDAAVDIAAALARRFEGFAARPYLCPAGVPSIGFGSTFYLDGRRVQLTDPPLTRDGAERLLLRQVERIYLPAVLRQCPGLRAEPPERLAAIIDWTFNLGEGALAASTLRRRINAGDWADVPAQLRRWVYARGVLLRGLVLRREAEALLI